MGCSPSKGQLFTGIYYHQDKALQFGSCEGNSDHFAGGTEIKSQTETEIASGGLGLSQEENPAVQLQGKKPTVCDIARESVDIGETNMHLPGENTERKDERRIPNNGCKRSRQKERLRKTVNLQSNSNLPQATVKAHEAAYVFMTNNITKFESLLGLLEKATQTQLSLQSIVTLLALQYEEINQTLEEIATEGEQMLAIYRSHKTLPAAPDDVPQNPDVPEAERNSGTEGSPDLLQHMLHRVIQKMRLVGDSVKELGDTSLEETSNYFNSLSQLLAEKLGAKRAVELRLKQVLNCVESYALRNLDSEDTALPSEDSGIGVENESHNGSVRYCSHQESAGLGVTPQSSYGCADGSLPNQACVNVDEDDDNADKDIDAEDSNDDEEPKQQQRRKSELTDQKMSNWYLDEPSQCPLQVNLHSKKPNNSVFEQSDQKDKNIRRPKSADDSSASFVGKHAPSHLWAAQRSRSADCLGKRMNDDMVQGRNRTNNNQKPEWITKRQNLSQFYHLKDGKNGPFKPGLIPSLMPAFAPVPPGKNAVRRLINKFSQGVCDIPNQKTLNEPTIFKGKKTSFLPVITKYRAGVSSSGNTNTNSSPLYQQFSVRPYHLDVNSFPPPPPEVLMDNSFNKKEVPTVEENGNETPNKNCYASQCQGAKMQTVLLPSQHTLNISETSLSGQDFVNDSHQKQDRDQSVGAKDKIEAIGLCHSTDILAKLGPEDEGINKSFAESGEETERSANKDSGEEAATLRANSRRPTSPVSRARIPPSSYSTCYRVPGPTALPPPPSYPVNIQEETTRVSVTSQVQKRTRKDSDDENGFMTASGLRSFYDARSVFCQENKLTFQSVKPSCRSTLPRPWGEPKISREKLQATCLPQTIRRSTLYGSTLTDHQLLLSGVKEAQYQDSESTTLNNGRKAYLAETAQCSEIPLSCSASGLQEAEAKITDKKD